MGITLVGSDADGANSDTLTGLSWPATDAGDTAWLVWTGSAGVTWTAAPGFTLVSSHDGDSGTLRSRLYYRVCDGAETGSITLTHSAANRQTAVMVVYRGGHASPLDDWDVRDEGAATTSHACPQVTTVAENCVVLTAISERVSSGTTDFTPPTPGYTERADSGSLGTGSGGTTTAFADDGLASGRAASTAVTPPDWTGAVSTGNVAVWTISMRPAETAPQIGQVTETDTAQAVTASRTYAAGQVTETDTAQALTASQVWEIGRVTETDTAQAMVAGLETSGLAQMPTIVVEVAFSTGASTGTLLHLDDPTRGLLDTGTLGSGAVDEPIWTDVTQWVNPGPITIERAASRVDSPIVEYETGKCSIVLDNSDRRFDPSNLSGPYVDGGATQVTARRAVRVTATWSDVVYELFRGFADQWLIAWQDPGSSTCTLTASDGFSVLAAIDRPAVTAVGGSELSGARINRILDSASWPADDRIIATGDSTLQETTLEGGALAELQLVADTEIGELYVDGGGRVVFRNRSGLLQDSRSNTSQGVFGDLDDELPYVDLAQSTDGSTFFNEVRVTRRSTGEGDEPVEQMVEDGTSKAIFYPKTYRPPSEPILETDGDALNYTSWLLHVASDPELRFTRLHIDPRYQPADLYPQALGRELGDRITVIRRPPGGGDPIQQDVFIRGVEHTISGVEWATAWTLQQADKYGSFLVLDDPLLGALDNNALAY